MSGKTIHASCVAFGDIGVLLRGPSGAGKSDLALRLVDAGAVLVSDDRVELAVESGVAVARPPVELAGLLEIRGLGIFRFPNARQAQVRLVCDLAKPGDIERLPEPRRCEYLGVRIRRIDVAPFEASAVVRVRIAAYAAAGESEPASGARPHCAPGYRDGG